MFFFMTIQEMKQQCDMKREAYEAMRASYRAKGRSRHSKIESYSAEQLQTSFAEYQEDAALFIFRLKSLRQGQFHSLLTQASRHHAAQVGLLFIRKAVKLALELVTYNLTIVLFFQLLAKLFQERVEVS
jgi:hypothetical protein